MKIVVAVLLLFAAAANAAEWSVETQTDRETYQPVNVLARNADNTIADEYASKQVTPRLQLRCMPGDATLQAQIDWDRFISSFNTEVTFAVEGRDPLTLTMGVDRSNKLTRAKSSDDARALADYLTGATTVTVTVSPYSEPPVSVTFDLAGFDAGLKALQESCAG